MKERPIIFGTWAIPKILDGSKTQTRRVIKPQPSFEQGVWYWQEGAREGEIQSVYYNSLDALKDYLIYRCPYGQVGDRLWARETWAISDFSWRRIPPVYDELRVAYKAGVSGLWHPDGATHDLEWRSVDELIFHKYAEKNKWQSPLFMPRWASRILLEITEVRVERLQEIGPEDIKAEGLMAIGVIPVKTAMLITGTDNLNDLQRELGGEEFASLWDFLNAKRGFSWASNPWVFVIAFKKLD